MNLGLRAGAQIVTMPRFDLEQFLALIAEHRVTQAFVVPPIALALAKHPAVDDADLSSLKLVMSGAAPLGAELTAKVAGRVGCPGDAGLRADGDQPGHAPGASWAKRGPRRLDRPAARRHRVPGRRSRDRRADAERGELWIRGPQVMQGYLNNAEATADTIDGDGWLHTGDIAQVDADGYFEIVDRLKELIKYKGFQVPPAELEALLINASRGRPTWPWSAFPTRRPASCRRRSSSRPRTPPTTSCIEFVAERVSPQKRVRLIERIDEIPKSPSGKILRRVLAERES